MGYDTRFQGKFNISPVLSLEDKNWLDNFSETDHRDDKESVPGFYCQWIPTEDGTAIEWDSGEKFYDYVEWIKWLIENFFAPKNYILNGKVKWSGDDVDDHGIIEIVNNVVTSEKF